MSGMVLGRVVMVIISAWGRFFMAWMPMAARVPRMVEITIASTATDSVTCRAFMMAVFWNRSMYACTEKPSHFARLRPALKDCTIKTTMGT